MCLIFKQISTLVPRCWETHAGGEHCLQHYTLYALRLSLGLLRFIQSLFTLVLSNGTWSFPTVTKLVLTGDPIHPSLPRRYPVNIILLDSMDLPLPCMIYIVHLYISYDSPESRGLTTPSTLSKLHVRKFHLTAALSICVTYNNQPSQAAETLGRQPKQQSSWRL